MCRVRCLGTGGYYQTDRRKTACYMVNNGIMLDAGSGVLNLIPEYVKDKVDILLSHIHIDHICGLFYLYSLRHQLGCEFRVHCSKEESDFIQQNLFNSRFFNPECFFEFVEIEDEFELNGIHVKCERQQHGKFGSRGFVLDGKIAYFTDTTIREKIDHKLDLLLHEAYNLDYDDTAHSSFSSLMKLYKNSNIDKLGIVHVNPTWSKEKLTEMQARVWVERGVISKQKNFAKLCKELNSLNRLFVANDNDVIEIN